MHFVFSETLEYSYMQLRRLYCVHITVTSCTLVFWIKEIEVILKDYSLLKREAMTFVRNLGMLGKNVLLLPFFTVSK
jgi:hypothetical protein